MGGDCLTVGCVPSKTLLRCAKAAAAVRQAAVGRKPTVGGLGLDTAGIDYDVRMGIAVNDRLQASNPDVFAVGDVASKYQFTHMADFGARLVLRNALFFGRDKFSNLLIPWATYTDPEVAHVGFFEKDLAEHGTAFTTISRAFDDGDRTVVDGETEGFVKVHVKKGADQKGSAGGDQSWQPDTFETTRKRPTNRILPEPVA
jgi:pyruvate/2-oxoglutarate dehydrogenase complex dihydrolipoamide dehydrogenase (E3) component